MRRVGGDRVIKLDIRVVAATNLEPTSAIQEGMLREDLYYRLNVIPIVLPPLRERGSDVELLFKSFLERFATENGKRTPKVTPSVWRTVERYSWPGNVREMLNVAQRVIILDDDDSITMSDLPEDLREGTKSFSRGESVLDIPYRDARRQAIQTFQDRYLEELLVKHEGNISRAAEAAGLSRRTLHRWLERNPSEEEAT